jgi:hypothetical protein
MGPTAKQYHFIVSKGDHQNGNVVRIPMVLAIGKEVMTVFRELR